jgi:hypothetical protein
MLKQEQYFKIFMRVIGSVSLLAIPAVFLPYSCMDAIHQRLGMGILPSEPIVGYLARSTSAFYAMLGGLLWVVSFDLYKYRKIIVYISCAMLMFGSALLVIDHVESMPNWWAAGEGPIVIVFGIIFFIMSRRIQSL